MGSVKRVPGHDNYSIDLSGGVEPFIRGRRGLIEFVTCSKRGGVSPTMEVGLREKGLY